MKRLSHYIRRVFNKTSQEQPKAQTVISAREQKIERGAKDFAARFEDVMRDLANG